MSTGTVTIDGSVANAMFTVGDGPYGRVDGSGTIRFNDGDAILVTTNGVLDLTALKFDLTGLTLRTNLLVDYRDGSLPGRPPELNGLLTDASASRQITLIDTNFQIHAVLPSAGTIVLIE